MNVTFGVDTPVDSEHQRLLAGVPGSLHLQILEGSSVRMVTISSNARLIGTVNTCSSIQATLQASGNLTCMHCCSNLCLHK